MNSGKVLIARLLPKAANATTVEYTVYARNADKTKAAEDELNLLKKSAQLEISQLESRQQSLQKGGFTEPRKMHNELRAMMKDHAKAEREVCREIHPAARKQNFTQEGMDDDDRKLATSSNVILKPFVLTVVPTQYAENWRRLMI